MICFALGLCNSNAYHFLQNNKELKKSGAGVVSFVMVNSKLPAPPEKKAEGEENIVVEQAVSLEDEDGDYSPKSSKREEDEEKEEEEEEEEESEESDESDD